MLESTCLEYEEAREGDEVRPGVLISLQNGVSQGNVQRDTSQTCFNQRQEPLCCYRGGGIRSVCQQPGSPLGAAVVSAPAIDRVSASALWTASYLTSGGKQTL